MSEEASNDLTSNANASNGAASNVRRGIRSDPEAYKAYQRDLMRRKRAEARAAQANAITHASVPEPSPSIKPQPPKKGGHKPGGAERYREALRQVEEIERQHAEEQTRKPKKPPVRYSEAVAEIILSRLEAGETLLSICSSDDMPDESSVRAWAADPAHPFSPRYVRAREVGYAKMADELLHIADDSRNDWVERETKDGKTERVVDHEHIKRSQLRVDTRKWLLSKMLPRVFGDKVDFSNSDGSLTSAVAGELETARRLAFLLSAGLALLPGQQGQIVDAEALPAPTSEGDDG